MPTARGTFGLNIPFVTLTEAGSLCESSRSKRLLIKGNLFLPLCCANVAGALHICGLDNGRYLHSIPYADGTWQDDWDDFTAAIQPSPMGGPIPHINAAGNDAGELLVTYQPGDALTAPVYAIRSAEGNWSGPTSTVGFVILELDI